MTTQQTIDDGGPAFPRFSSGSTMDGMSLRDWLAGQALAGLIGLPRPNASIHQDAVTSYMFADAMIAARKEAV